MPEYIASWINENNEYEAGIVDMEEGDGFTMVRAAPHLNQPSSKIVACVLVEDFSKMQAEMLRQLSIHQLPGDQQKKVAIETGKERKPVKALF